MCTHYLISGIDKISTSRILTTNDLAPSPSYYMPTSQIFDWDAYLTETNSEAAPDYCFKQVRDKLLICLLFYYVIAVFVILK